MAIEHDNKELKKYIAEIDGYYRSGDATEHSYRPALQTYLKSVLGSDMEVTNEPKLGGDVRPDYLVTYKKISLGYIEAKDLGKDLDHASHDVQFKRYQSALPNLIITDYMEFRLFRDGYPEPVKVVKIAEIRHGRVKSKPENFADLDEFLAAFSGHTLEIKTPDELADKMARKARLLVDVIDKAVTQDISQGDKIEENDHDLITQFHIFKTNLIQDLSPSQFADMYAQTIVYGMFAARFHASTSPTFSRKDAPELIPTSNPFLRKFFHHIVGIDIDQRLEWMIDDITAIFQAVNLAELMADYGKSTYRRDPFLHFYENFLEQYDPDGRAKRGVYYTPEPVVNFIVRAVDHILKTELDLPDGIANTDKTTIEVLTDPANSESPKEKKDVHRVQILDPAAGTGTFLAAIVKHIHENYYSNQKGAWSDDANDHLIPRLNGFELLMAAYTIAHTKLDMVLRETGVTLFKDKRLGIFLTNSLEEGNPKVDSLLSPWLSKEAKGANNIKHDMPVMVVLGNPPYAVKSSNKGKWIKDLIAIYKEKLNEQKINLDDDYIKFIRYGEHLVEKNGRGVLAYISNNSFLSGITHRQMRKCLLDTFDTIYVLDLHGTPPNKGAAPNGLKDQNVFEITQGVSINLFVKTGPKKDGELAKVFHHNLYGTKQNKFDFLNDNDLPDVEFTELKPQASYYFFVPKDWESQSEYEKGFSLTKLFPEYVSGVCTNRDPITVHFNNQSLRNTINDFIKLTKEEIAIKYKTKDARDWKIDRAKEDVKANLDNSLAWQDLSYRPFDTRKTFYSGKQNGFVCNGRYKVMRHMLQNNIGLIICRQTPSSNAFYHTFLTANIVEMCYISNKGSEINSIFPLYNYPKTVHKTIDGKTTRKPNFDKEFVEEIAAGIGLPFTPEKKSENKNTFAPIDLLDYIYAVLHAPAYREKYKEFLKIDFPRVPYPTDAKLFWQLVALGGELRALHLMESPTLNTLITQYPNSGDHMVATPKYEITDHVKRLGKVYINRMQFFDGVPEVAWCFYIGGFQPAQKWLKDRAGMTLSGYDIRHYQKIIVALMQTHRLMGDIDKVWMAA